MSQFYLPPEAVKEKSFHLEGPEAFHILKVLRFKEGQSLDLFDGRGGRYKGTITRVGKEQVEGTLTETLAAPHAGPAVRLQLFQGLLKASHWEWVLEKGTEVGVDRFIPVITPRTVVLLKEAERIQSKLERWGKITLAAAKQSRRARLPEIAEPAHFRDAIHEAAKAGLVVLGWEKMAGAHARDTLKEALAGAAKKGKGPFTVSLFVGPEGGFSEEEVELAESAGAVLFGLGSATLRAETAAVVSSAVILYELGAL